MDVIVTGAIEKAQKSQAVINTANTYPYPTVLLTWVHHTVKSATVELMHQYIKLSKLYF